MNDQPWWERWPDVLARETFALDSANIRWTRNDSVFAKGVMRLDLILPSELADQKLSVVYPDDYPYFRCQVYAADLELPFHQNPFERNLCLLGRRTHYWNNDGTAAELITEQLPKLLTSAAATDAESVEGLEQQQAEPFSDFYPYQPCMIMVQSDWHIPPEHVRGTLTIATLQSCAPTSDLLIRGAVIDVRGETGEVLCAASPALRTALSARQFEAPWARVKEPINEAHEGRFIEHLLQLHPELPRPKPTRVEGGWLGVWAVLFPEQVRHRVVGEGWVFVCAFDKERSGFDNSRPPRAPKPKQGKHSKKG